MTRYAVRCVIVSAIACCADPTMPETWTTFSESVSQCQAHTCFPFDQTFVCDFACGEPGDGIGYCPNYTFGEQQYCAEHCGDRKKCDPLTCLPSFPKLCIDGRIP